MKCEKPKYFETLGVDDIKCPWCGEAFDGKSATNNDQDCDYVNCPKCEKQIHVYQSVEYLAHPVGEDGEDL